MVPGHTLWPLGPQKGTRIQGQSDLDGETGGIFSAFSAPLPIIVTKTTGGSDYVHSLTSMKLCLSSDEQK